MRVAAGVVPHPAFFAAVQSAAFWFSLFYAVLRLMPDPRRGLLACAVLALHPVFWPYSVTLWKDVWVAILFLLALPHLTDAWQRREGKPLARSVLLIAAAACFRHDAVMAALLPAALGWRVVPSAWPRWSRLAVPVAILLTVAAAPRLVEQMPGVRVTPSGQAYLVTQYLGVMARVDPASAEFRHSRDAFDQQFGAGMLERLLASFDLADGHFMIRIIDPSNPIITMQELETRRSFVVRLVARTAMRHPLLFLRHKAEVLMYALQFRISRYHNFITVVIPNPYGVKAHSLLPGVRSRVEALLARTDATPLWYHWPHLAASAGGVVLAIRRRHAALGVACALAQAHAVAFLIPDIQPQFRYLFGAYACTWVGWLSFLLGPARAAGASA